MGAGGRCAELLADGAEHPETRGQGTLFSLLPCALVSLSVC
jgi:hypothetical protein